MRGELPTHVWVSALLRRASAGGAFAVVLHKGDAERGDVLIKVRAASGSAAAYAPAFAPGEASFERVGSSDEEDAVDDLIRRRLGRDRDLWVIEIEDREGRHFLTERVISSSSS
ncbi:MAG: DUF1491 family protein [Alphaproteobacteria bacterium]|nr:DUF1491 family protein [Alphaproteobacteria bacterium]